MTVRQTYEPQNDIDGRPSRLYSLPMTSSGLPQTFVADTALALTVALLPPSGSRSPALGYTWRSNRRMKNPEKTLRVDALLRNGDVGDASWCEIEDELWKLTEAQLREIEKKVNASR